MFFLLALWGIVIVAEPERPPLRAYVNDRVVLKDAGVADYTGRVGMIWVDDNGTSTILWFGDSDTSPVRLSSFPTTSSLFANYLALDGTNTPTATINWGAQSLIGVLDFRTSGLLVTSSGNTSMTGWLRIGDAYTLPATDGSNGNVLVTNGSGAVSWQAQSGGGGGSSNMWTLSGINGLSTTGVTNDWMFRNAAIVFTTTTAGAETNNRFSHLETTSSSLRLIVDRDGDLGGSADKTISIWDGYRSNMAARSAALVYTFDDLDGLLQFQTYDGIGYGFFKADHTSGAIVGRTAGSGNRIFVELDGDVTVRLNDAAGADYFKVRNSNEGDVFTVSSDGSVTASEFNGNLNNLAVSGAGLDLAGNTISLDVTPSAGNATLEQSEDALQVKYLTTYLSEGASGLTLSATAASSVTNAVVDGDPNTVLTNAAGYITSTTIDVADLGGGSEGDVLYRDASKWHLLPIGSPGQVLEVAVGGTSVEWDTDDSNASSTIEAGDIGANAVFLSNLQDDMETSLSNALTMPVGSTNNSMADPGADRILMWDESSNSPAWATAGTNLSWSDTMLNAAGGSGTDDDWTSDPASNKLSLHADIARLRIDEKTTVTANNSTLWSASDPVLQIELTGTVTANQYLLKMARTGDTNIFWIDEDGDFGSDGTAYPLSISCGSAYHSLVGSYTGNIVRLNANGGNVVVEDTLAAGNDVTTVTNTGVLRHRGWSPTIQLVAAATSITASSVIVSYIVTGNVNIELPDPTTCYPGRTFTIKATHASGCTVTTNNDDADIDGALYVHALTQYKACDFQTNGTAWYRMRQY